MAFTPNKKKPRPPYLLGILCLIPVVGAFVGFGLILFGIIKYKDKWLVAIGTGGILFTFIIFSSLLYFLFHGKIPNEQFQTISKTQLNNIVRNIEFYKIQNGSYPNSLRELDRQDIHDPIQMFSSVEHDNFNYEKIGDKYLLYSSGKDGIPKTYDDLYPDIKIKDSTKIGLIFRK